MNEILKQIQKTRIVPVVVLKDVQDALPLAKALCEGGISCAEITFRTDAAEESIRMISKNYPDMLVGAGTVLTTKQVDKAINAGAKFMVSPGLNPKVVKYCIEKNIPIMPGVSSPSDIEQAIELGLDAVKFFPAEALGGLKLLKAMAAPYSNMMFMPTGGLNEKNINSYLAFPKVLACGGSWMVSEDLIKERNFNKIYEFTKEAVEIILKSESKINTNNNNKDKSDDKNNIIKNKKIDVQKKVVTFGEIMLRLAPQGYLRFVQADNFEATYGGGEANVAVSLANYGFDAKFVSKLPKHEIGQAAVNSLRKYGVDTSYISRGGDRVGIYYLEKGASQRPSKVVYDRSYSSVATASKDDFNWKEIFKDVDWFHFTGITPALSDTMADVCLEACKAAKEACVTISCDLNYRNKLWSKEKAGQVMSKLCEYVDVCIANEEDAADVFGIKAKDTDVTTGVVNHEGYKDVARQLVERFDFSKVAITLRESLSANDNNWSAMLYDGKEYFFSKQYKIHIVDRVGGGDSFGAGLICAALNDYDSKNTIEFATAASCLKHSVEGDFNQVSMDEVLKLAGGDASGRVQR